MSVNKITTAPQPIDEVNKINEIIDELGNKVDDSDVVHKTGSENIAGVKSFTSTLYNKKEDPGIVLQHTAVTKGVAPSENESWVVAMTDSVGATVINRLSALGSILTTNSTSNCFLRAYKSASGSTDSVDIGVTYPASGRPYAYTVDSDAAGSVLTTSLISKSNTGGYVKLGNGMLIQRGYVNISSTGEQTVTFPKAFSSATSYVMLKSQNSSSTGSTQHRQGDFYSQTTTSAKTYTNSNDTSRIFWLAIGW